MLKIQFLNVNININQWTNGRWAVPISELWEKEIDSSYDILCFPIQKYNYKRTMSIKRKCKICNREFTINSSKQIMCGFCFDINKCDLCGKIFITHHQNIKSKNKFCSHECSRKFASLKMNDFYKEHPEKRKENMINNHKQNDKIKFCEICKQTTKFIIGIGCINCYNKTNKNRIIASKNYMTNLWKNNIFREKSFNKSFCEKCNEITDHRFYTCLKCNPNAKGSVNPNFITKDNVLYFYDRSIGDYISWECYKKNFIVNINRINNDLLNDFKIYPTFRIQDSEDWSGGTKQAFEQSLVDDDITWFIYIKFYLDEQNTSKPLVCGKSGSILVNSSGSDLSFSTDINDGPARRFLAENSGKYLWDKTKIAILPCNSEKEAYELENKYTELLNLFRS